ncbi:MAG: prepilin peptidase [Patescibacteria group bacterium]
MFLFLAFIIGLFFGSFLNVLANRIPRGEKLTGRSHCEFCHKTLFWKDLVPVFSFVYLWGKCRYCHHPLSYQYLFVELVTGLLFVITYAYVISGGIFNFQFLIFNEFLNLNSLIINLVYYLFMVSSLIVIFFADLKHGIIPDKIVIPAIVVSFAYLLIIHQSSIINHLLSALLSFGFFLIIYILTKGRAMGFGDVKFAFFIGLFLGFPAVLFAFYIAFLTGGIVGIILILWKKKALKSAIPFGPFLVIGSVLGLFLQSVIIHLISPLL